jgi:hypothetical protein
VRWVALALVALALTGCETTAEKSGRLEKQAGHGTAQQKGLSIVHPSTVVKVTSTTLLRSSEGVAAVVTLRNTSSQTLRKVPIAIDVKDAHGVSLYRNDAAGLAAALVSVPSLAPHGALTWIDDQIPAGAAHSVAVEVGEVAGVANAVPSLTIVGAHQIEDPANGPGAEGMVVNHSRVSQQELVVYGLAVRGTRIAAAGRAIVPSVPAGGSTRFQVFFIGDPRGTRLQFSAPPTALE